MVNALINPRESGKFIADRSKDVFVVEENMRKAAQTLYDKLKEEKYSFHVWKEQRVHPKIMNDDTIDWIFVIDSLNFSFWLPSVEQFQLEHEGVVYEDYEALCTAINRALKEGIPITSPSYYKDLSLDVMKHIFRSCNGTTLPLLEERTQHLRQSGSILCQNFGGSFVNVLSKCKGDVNVFIDNVTQLFPSFRDISIFEGQPVSFCKRVQILIADIWACFEGKGPGKFDNISELTMFADYRVPQALQALDILKYSTGLFDKLKNNIELNSGSVQEMEIRGCSIHSVELLRKEIELLLKSDTSGEYENITLNSVIIDFYLWGYATQDSEKMLAFPEHKTRSIFY